MRRLLLLLLNWRRNFSRRLLLSPRPQSLSKSMQLGSFLLPNSRCPLRGLARIKTMREWICFVFVVQFELVNMAAFFGGDCGRSRSVNIHARQRLHDAAGVLDTPRKGDIASRFPITLRSGGGSAVDLEVDTACRLLAAAVFSAAWRLPQLSGSRRGRPHPEWLAAPVLAAAAVIQANCGDRNVEPITLANELDILINQLISIGMQPG